MHSVVDRAGPVLHLLLRYTQALITQMAQTAVCNRHHSLHQQLCRWLLLSFDRLPGDELVMTHELIANMLGVRREGVTEGALKLQQAGIIQSSGEARQRATPCFQPVSDCRPSQSPRENAPRRAPKADLEPGVTGVRKQEFRHEGASIFVFANDRIARPHSDENRPLPEASVG